MEQQLQTLLLSNLTSPRVSPCSRPWPALCHCFEELTASVHHNSDFSLSCDQIHKHTKRSERGRVVWACSLRVQSTMAGRHEQDCEAAGQGAAVVRKQEEMNAGAQLDFSLSRFRLHGGWSQRR